MWLGTPTVLFLFFFFFFFFFLGGGGFGGGGECLVHFQSHTATPPSQSASGRLCMQLHRLAKFQEHSQM